MFSTAIKAMAWGAAPKWRIITELLTEQYKRLIFELN